MEDELPNTVAAGSYKISFITAGTMSEPSLSLGDLDIGSSLVEKGWSLGNDGAIVYSFESEAKAKEMASKYLVEGELTGRHVFMPFTSTASSVQQSKALFTFFTTGVMPSGSTGGGSSLTLVSQGDICNEPAGCTCTDTATTIGEGVFCDSINLGFVTDGDVCNTGVGCICDVTGDTISYGATCQLPSINNGQICNTGSGCTCTVTGNFIAQGDMCEAPAATTGGNFNLAGYMSTSSFFTEGATITPNLYFVNSTGVANSTISHPLTITYEYRESADTDYNSISNGDLSITLNTAFTYTLPAGTDIHYHYFTFPSFTLVADGIPEPREYYDLVITDIIIHPSDIAAGITLDESSSLTTNSSELGMSSYIQTSDGYTNNSAEGFQIYLASLDHLSWETPERWSGQVNVGYLLGIYENNTPIDLNDYVEVTLTVESDNYTNLTVQSSHPYSVNGGVMENGTKSITGFSTIILRVPATDREAPITFLTPNSGTELDIEMLGAVAVSPNDTVIFDTPDGISFILE